MGKPRKQGYKDFPPNLYFDRSTKHYRYLHPQTKKFYPMGNDRNKAISAAKQLNSILMSAQDLVANVLGTSITLTRFIEDKFVPYLLEKKGSQNTKDGHIRKLKHIKKAMGNIPIDKITVTTTADYLDKLPDKNSNRHRSLLSLIFTLAISKGLITSNPAIQTLKKEEEKDRRRLSEEWFAAIYAKADKFLQDAMDLALLTLQRREEIVIFKFGDCKKETIKDEYEQDIEAEFLYVIQKKTEKHGEAAYIKIKVGEKLKKVINRCKDNILSTYMVHRLPKRIVKSKNRSHHTQILPDYLTKAFGKTRDVTGLFDDIPEKERPTFHEIRALGIMLYEKGGINPDNLAGHMTEEMRKLYRSGHGTQWTEVVSF